MEIGGAFETLATLLAVGVVVVTLPFGLALPHSGAPLRSQIAEPWQALLAARDRLHQLAIEPATPQGARINDLRENLRVVSDVLDAREDAVREVVQELGPREP